MYEEMEVDAEMQRGLLPGALALSAKFVPAIRAVASRTVEVCLFAATTSRQQRLTLGPPPVKTFKCTQLQQGISALMACTTCSNHAAMKPCRVSSRHDLTRMLCVDGMT